MPKETIKDPRSEDSNELIVKWVRDCFVEVGVAPDETPASGAYINLDRSNLNRLIRSLRRARDQAFGVDA
jgi:hypothetical protein